MAPANNMSFMESVTRESLGGSASIFLNVWIYFNLIGNTILLPLVVLTFLFSKTAKRHPTLVNLCMTWIFSGVFSLLLFYAKQHVGREPDPSLCAAQASLLAGITPMWSVAVLALVCYMLHTLRGESSQSRLLKGLPMAIMLSAPYVAQCSFTIAALMLSFRDPRKVNRHQGFFFCSLYNVPLFLTMATFTTLICIIIVVIEVALAVVICRNWRTRRSAGLPSELPWPLIARVFLFGVYVAIGMGVNVLSMFSSRLPADVFGATAGTVVFLIFGTQADVFRAWCFWRKWDEENLSQIQSSQPTLDIRFSATSLGAIFKSPRSDKINSWSEGPSRPASHPSTHRSSTKNFVRLVDNGSIGDLHRKPSRRSAVRENEEEEKQVNLKDEPKVTEPQKSPRRPKSRERWKGEDKEARSDEERMLQYARKRRREHPPRPKGPRKASISSMTSAFAAGSTIGKPAATFQPADFVPGSVDSSRTLGVGSANSSTPLS